MKRIVWVVVGMAAIYSALFVQAQLHRMGGAVIAPHLALELGLGTADLGLVIGVMFIASAASQPIAGVLLDRFGPVIAVTYLAPLAIVGMVLFAWSESVTGLTFGRILIGAGFSCVVSGIYLFLLGWVEPKNFTTAAATIQAIPGSIAVLIASTPLAYGLATFGRGPVFMTLAVTSAVVIVLVAFSVKEGPLSDRAKRPKQSVRESFGGLSTILRTPSYIWLALFSLTALGPAFSVIGLLSGVYLRERFALDPVELGNAVLVLLVALNLGGVVYGPLDRWATHRKRVVSGGIVVQVTALSLLAALGGLSLWLTLGLLIVFAGASQLHALVIAHAQSLFPRDVAGRVITTTNLFMIGGIFLFQFLSGYAHEFFVIEWGLNAIESYRLTFAVLAVAQCVGILLYAKAPVPAKK